MRLSVPGNILLLGEYAVLEEGGLGLAMAVERRVRVSTQPSKGLSIEGAWPGGALAVAPGETSANPVAAAVLQAVEEWLARKGASRPAWNQRIRVDSSELYRPDGRKLGLGSSAAVTVGLACALIHAAGIGSGPLHDAVPELALRAHRRAQGGLGSGYDVTCSFYGGMGIFHGGAIPSWEPCRLAWDPGVLLFPGPGPVMSSDAVRAYLRWKERNPGAAREFLEQSNRALLDFVRAGAATEAASAFDASRRIGLALGDAIGTPALIEAPGGLDPGWCKALGAGNELGACLLPVDNPAVPGQEEIQRVPLSPQGVRWED